MYLSRGFFIVRGSFVSDRSYTTYFVFISATIHFSLPFRAFLIVLYLFPVSMLLGFFFPAGMRIVGAMDKDQVVWFWGINGIASVVGSVISVVVAMSYGFHVVLCIVMFFYAVVALLLFPLKKYT